MSTRKPSCLSRKMQKVARYRVSVTSKQEYALVEMQGKVLSNVGVAGKTFGRFKTNKSHVEVEIGNNTVAGSRSGIEKPYLVVENNESGFSVIGVTTELIFIDKKPSPKIPEGEMEILMNGRQVHADRK